MRFYNRQNELEALQRVHSNISSSARLTVLTGKRRIGKTRLIKHFCSPHKSLYFFISRKSEKILCEEYLGYIEESLQIKNYGKIDKLADIIRLLFDYSKNNRIIVVIDEFQELLQISPSFISEFQHIWDSNKDTGQLHLIVSGSVYSMMRKIFEDYRQPLYGRADLLINLNPLPIKTIKEILEEQEAD